MVERIVRFSMVVALATLSVSASLWYLDAKEKELNLACMAGLRFDGIVTDVTSGFNTDDTYSIRVSYPRYSSDPRSYDLKAVDNNYRLGQDVEVCVDKSDPAHVYISGEVPSSELQKALFSCVLFGGLAFLFVGSIWLWRWLRALMRMRRTDTIDCNLIENRQGRTRMTALIESDGNIRLLVRLPVWIPPKWLSSLRRTPVGPRGPCTIMKVTKRWVVLAQSDGQKPQLVRTPSTRTQACRWEK